MKVLFDGIIYSFKKNYGVRRYFDELLYELPAIHKKIELELLLPFNTMGPLNFKKNIKIIKNNSFGPLKTNANIFHTSYYTQYRDRKIPQIVTTYDMIHEKFPQYFPGIRNKIFLRRKKKTIESASAIICISQNTKKDLLKYCQVDKSKITVIYPGINPFFKKSISSQRKKQFFEKYKIKRPFLLYVGQRGRYKNFLGVLQAYAKWNKDKNFDFITVGGNNFLPKELTYFKKLNIIDKLFNFQNISDKELVDFYNYAHAFISPSLYEGFGLPLVEAMACGCLVLAANNACFSEVVRDNGIFFSPENPESINKALNDSLDKHKKQVLIKKGLKRAKYFTWEKTARQTLSLYERLYGS